MILEIENTSNVQMCFPRNCQSRIHFILTLWCLIFRHSFVSFPVIWSKFASFSQRTPKWQCFPKLGIISSKLSVRLSSGHIPGNRGGERCLVFHHPSITKSSAMWLKNMKQGKAHSGFPVLISVLVVLPRTTRANFGCPHIYEVFVCGALLTVHDFSFRKQIPSLGFLTILVSQMITGSGCLT